MDFDKTKHLSDRMIRKRRLEREKLEALENLRLEQVQQEREEEEMKREVERSVPEWCFGFVLVRGEGGGVFVWGFWGGGMGCLLT